MGSSFFCQECSAGGLAAGFTSGLLLSSLFCQGFKAGLPGCVVGGLGCSRCLKAGLLLVCAGGGFGCLVSSDLEASLLCKGFGEGDLLTCGEKDFGLLGSSGLSPCCQLFLGEVGMLTGLEDVLSSGWVYFFFRSPTNSFLSNLRPVIGLMSAAGFSVTRSLFEIMGLDGLFFSKFFIRYLMLGLDGGAGFDADGVSFVG